MSPDAAISRSTCGRRQSPPGGFTLIETLATLTLAAIVLPAVMNGISLAVSASGLAKRQTEAAWLAHSKLSQIIAERQWQQASQTGDFGTDWPGYHWSAQITGWNEGTLRQLDVTVIWQHQGKQRDTTLTTLVYAGGSQ